MLEIVQKVMLVEVLYQVRYHVLKSLAEYTCEGDRSVICGGSFIAFLKKGLTWARHHSGGSLPVIMERSKLPCIMGAIS